MARGSPGSGKPIKGNEAGFKLDYLVEEELRLCLEDEERMCLEQEKIIEQEKSFRLEEAKRMRLEEKKMLQIAKDASRLFHPMDAVWLADDIEQFLDLWVDYMWHGRPENANWAMVSFYFAQLLLQNSIPLFYANGDKYATPWSEVDQSYVVRKWISTKRRNQANDKTEHGMEKTVQNQGQSPKMPSQKTNTEEIRSQIRSRN
ncbi:hypothetical protein Tco_0880483 [Tanacetum coccineum]